MVERAFIASRAQVSLGSADLFGERRGIRRQDRVADTALYCNPGVDRPRARCVARHHPRQVHSRQRAGTPAARGTSRTGLGIGDCSLDKSGRERERSAVSTCVTVYDGCLCAQEPGTDELGHVLVLSTGLAWAVLIDADAHQHRRQVTFAELLSSLGRHGQSRTRQLAHTEEALHLRAAGACGRRADLTVGRAVVSSANRSGYGGPPWLLFPRLLASVIAVHDRTARPDAPKARPRTRRNARRSITFGALSLARPLTVISHTGGTGSD